MKSQDESIGRISTLEDDPNRTRNQNQEMGIDFVAPDFSENLQRTHIFSKQFKLNSTISVSPCSNIVIFCTTTLLINKQVKINSSWNIFFKYFCRN